MTSGDRLEKIRTIIDAVCKDFRLSDYQVLLCETIVQLVADSDPLVVATWSNAILIVDAAAEILRKSETLFTEEDKNV